MSCACVVDAIASLFRRTHAHTSPSPNTSTPPHLTAPSNSKVLLLPSTTRCATRAERGRARSGVCGAATPSPASRVHTAFLASPSRLRRGRGRTRAHPHPRARPATKSRAQTQLRPARGGFGSPFVLSARNEQGCGFRVRVRRDRGIFRLHADADGARDSCTCVPRRIQRGRTDGRTERGSLYANEMRLDPSINLPTLHHVDRFDAQKQKFSGTLCDTAAAAKAEPYACDK